MELISRRGALQAIARLKSDYDCDYNTIVEKCRDAVKRLSAHGEERKTGKWIPAIPLPMEADSYKHKRYWKCSVCGGHDFFNPQYSEKIKFCRYCGAELEVDDVRY